MSTAAAKAKNVGRKIADAASDFFIPELDGVQMLAKGGRALLRGGTYIGMSYLVNAPKVMASPIGKHIGWISLIIGTGAEMFMNDANNASVALSGISQGLSTFGMVDSTKRLLGANAAKWGLLGTSGLGATYEQPSNGDMDWYALSQRAEAMAQGMNGGRLVDDSPYNMAGLGATLSDSILMA